MKTNTAAAHPAPDPTPEHIVQQIIDRLRQVYRNNLSKHAEGRTALTDYSLSDLTILERYFVGYSDGMLPKLIPSDKVFRAQLEALGVLGSDGKEAFHGCPVFPIDSAEGRRLNLWACSKDGLSRFLKGRPVSLWNAVAAKHSAELLVFTSPIEALSAAVAGCSNISALDPDNGALDHKEITGWGVQKIRIVVADTTSTVLLGEQIKARFKPLAAEISKIPGCASINSLLKAKGAPAVAVALAAATLELATLSIPGMELRADGFVLTLGGRSYKVRGLQMGPQKLTAIVSREQNGKMHLDKVDLMSARSRKEFIRELVRIFQEQADVLEADVEKILKACELRASEMNVSGPSVPKPGTIPEADRKEGEALGRDPRLIELILRDYDLLGLAGERANKLLSYFAMSSRKLRRPLAVLTVALSGSGKSALQEVTVLLCPPDELEKITIFSGKADRKTHV